MNETNASNTDVHVAVTLRLVDALKAMGSQLVTQAENMVITCRSTSSFGDLGVVLNAPTNKRDGLITCIIGYYCIYLIWDLHTSF